MFGTGALVAPPNSSQQPTRGRSLARRFRASFCATLRVALPDREGRARLSERTLAGRRRGGTISVGFTNACTLASHRTRSHDSRLSETGAIDRNPAYDHRLHAGGKPTR